MTPGRNCSTMTSARLSRGSSRPRSAASFKSRATLRLPRLRSAKLALSRPQRGAWPRISSPRPGGSILTTSAPASAKSSVANGPGSKVEKSRTNRPSSGRIALFPIRTRAQYLSWRSICFGRAAGEQSLLPRRELHHLRPLLGVAPPHRAERFGRHQNGLPADLGEPRGDARIGEPSVDLAVERGDDRGRRGGGNGNPGPATDLVAFESLADGRHVGHCGRPRVPG